MFAALLGNTDCWAVVQVYISTVMSLESMIGFSTLNSVSEGMFNYSRFLSHLQCIQFKRISKRRGLGSLLYWKDACLNTLDWMLLSGTAFCVCVYSTVKIQDTKRTEFKCH